MLQGCGLSWSVHQSGGWVWRENVKLGKDGVKKNVDLWREKKKKLKWNSNKVLTLM